MDYYAGIGSREVDDRIKHLFEATGKYFAARGFGLRSGAAVGCDESFERGCDFMKGPKQILLPWKWFNDHKSEFCNPPLEAYEIAKAIHPAWNKVKIFDRPFHARNVQQILGPNLEQGDSTKVVICWHDGSGGTMTAVNLAIKQSIPVLNVRDYEKALGFELNPKYIYDLAIHLISLV